MKPRSLFAVSFSAGLLALTLTGCSSVANRQTGPDAGRPVGGKSLDILQLRDNVKSTRIALNRTTDALNRIPGSPGAQQAYTAFGAELSAFQKLASQTLQESADVRNLGRELFAQWDLEAQSIKNPDIRAVAEQRRVALHQAYNEMGAPLIAARADLSAVRSDFVDIQKALSLDLTPAGVKAAEKLINEINHEAANSSKSLDALADKLDAIAASLPAATVTPAR